MYGPKLHHKFSTAVLRVSDHDSTRPEVASIVLQENGEAHPSTAVSESLTRFTSRYAHCDMGPRSKEEGRLEGASGYHLVSLFPALESITTATARVGQRAEECQLRSTRDGCIRYRLLAFAFVAQRYRTISLKDITEYISQRFGAS